MSVVVAQVVLEQPLWLLGWLAVAMAAWQRRRARVRARSLAPLHAIEAAGPLPRSTRSHVVALPAVLGTVALALGVFALAGPRVSYADAEPMPAADLGLALDVSSSMRARDLDRERMRLDVARDAARAFVAARPRDRIGLLVFARYPDLLAPPTTDHDALLSWLDAIQPVAADGPEDATGIGTALARLVDVLSPTVPGERRVAVLLTDGEENVARTGRPGEIDPLHATQWARAQGVVVHVVTVGATPSAEAAARSAAWFDAVRATGGEVHAAEDAEAVEAAWQRIDDLTRSDRIERRERWRPLHAVVIGVALVLFLLAALLGSSVLAVRP
ncbi:MAG: VWA domain-containing protein [Planctomycetota bacterium]